MLDPWDNDVDVGGAETMLADKPEVLTDPADLCTSLDAVPMRLLLLSDIFREVSLPDSRLARAKAVAASGRKKRERRRCALGPSASRGWSCRWSARQQLGGLVEKEVFWMTAEAFCGR